MFSNVCSGGVGLRFIRGLFKFIVNAVLLLLVVYTVLNAIGGIETDVEPVVDVTQLRASLVPLSYDDLARYPDENKGKSVVYRGKVVQKVSDTTFRVNITQDKYGFWSDTVYVELKGQAKEARILEDDIIELLGVTNGERSYRAVLGNRITIPRISVYEARVLAKAGGTMASARIDRRRCPKQSHRFPVVRRQSGTLYGMVEFARRNCIHYRVFCWGKCPP